jgi:hypothetical protein
MKLVAGFSLSTLAALAGCAHEDRVIPAPAPVVVNPPPPSTVVVPPQSSATVPGAVVVAPAPAPLQAGYGRVETIVPVPAAAAGATVPPATKRVGIRMDSGIVQYLDTNATGLSIGERIEITSDGMMRRPAP